MMLKTGRGFKSRGIFKAWRAAFRIGHQPDCEEAAAMRPQEMLGRARIKLKQDRKLP
jgi:hypothetical protein